MTAVVKTLGRNDQLSIADDVMHAERIRHLPVLDESGQLCGIVSQRDMFRGALAAALGYGEVPQRKLLATLVVKEVMTTDVIALLGARLHKQRVSVRAARTPRLSRTYWAPFPGAGSCTGTMWPTAPSLAARQRDIGAGRKLKSRDRHLRRCFEQHLVDHCLVA